MKKIHAEEARRNVDRLLTESIATVHYLLHRKSVALAAMQVGDALFCGCHDRNGRPLGATDRTAITRFLDDPSSETWCAISAIVVSGGADLAHDWRKFDRRAESQGNTGYPSPAVLRLVIRASVEENLSEIMAQLTDLESGDSC